MASNDGKWLEKKVQEALHYLQSNTRSLFHRFPDSTAARGFISPQPGDFLWLLPDRPAILLEVKSTVISKPLNGLLKPGQCGKHRLWHRSGHSSAFIYGDKAKDFLAWYDGKSVVNPEVKVSSIKPLWQGNLESVLDMMNEAGRLYKAT